MSSSPATDNAAQVSVGGQGPLAAIAVGQAGAALPGEHPGDGDSQGESGLYGDELGGIGWEVRPARSTIRQVANRQGEDKGGEDTVDWGWLVRWPERKLDQLRESIAKAQKAAQGNDVQGASVELGGCSWLAGPGGVRIGGLYFAWVVEWCGIRMAVMDRESPWGETPNVRIHVGSMPLLQSDLAGIYRNVRAVVEAEGGEILGEKVSRVDSCLDLVGVPVADFVLPFLRGEVVRRGVNYAVYGKGLGQSGFEVGSGAVKLRVYDKVRECQESGTKWDLMIANRYDGEVPGEATRVEFQLRRKALKELEVETVEGWLAKRAAVLDYLTGNWFRLTATAVDRDNSQRAGPSELWQRVSEGFAGWAGLAVLPAVRIVKRKVLEVGGLVRQFVGCVTSAAAVRGATVTAFSDVVRFAGDLLEAFADELGPRAVERYLEKRILFEASTPVVALA